MPPGTRNTADDDLGEFSPVENFAELADFCCDDPDLDDFFSHDAEPQQNALLSKTYAYRFRLNAGLSAPVAAASLLNDSIKLAPEAKAACDLDGVAYQQFPAVKIGRLGTHAALQGQGIGTAVLNLIKLLFIRRNRTGCRFLTVDAYNCERVLAFYRKNGFTFYTAKDASRDSRLMYFDLLRFKRGLEAGEK